jgi:hypothetical protein
VELVDVRFDSTRMTIDIDAEEGVTYRTEFIGATREDDDIDPTARVLRTIDGDSATYDFQGDELYVRARVTSSRLHPRPYRNGDFEMAWAQPVLPAVIRHADAPKPAP